MVLTHGLFYGRKLEMKEGHHPYTVILHSNNLMFLCQQIERVYRHID